MCVRAEAHAHAHKGTRGPWQGCVASALSAPRFYDHKGDGWQSSRLCHRVGPARAHIKVRVRVRSVYFCMHVCMCVRRYACVCMHVCTHACMCGCVRGRVCVSECAVYVSRCMSLCAAESAQARARACPCVKVRIGVPKAALRGPSSALAAAEARPHHDARTVTRRFKHWCVGVQTCAGDGDTGTGSTS
jgi:hypothetical protein